MNALVAIAAAPIAFFVIRALQTSALGRRLVAEPSSERWHGSSTPTFGGVGIYVGFLAGVTAALLVGAIDPTEELFGVVGGCTVIFVFGLLDDAYGLPPVAKLLGQFAAAAIVIASGLHVELFTNDIVAVALAIAWLVGITNAFNLLDNMDGLAATLATVACAYFAIDSAAVHDNVLVIVLSLSLGFACLGFLPYNIRSGQEAAVFMGDGGSQLLGFGLACMGLAASWTAAGTTVATVLLPLIVLAIPILDTTLVTIMRVLERRPVTQGGKDHTSHRLVYYGLSEREAVGLLAIVAVALGATGLAYNVLDNGRVTAIGVLVSVVLLVQFGNFLTELREHAAGDGPSADAATGAPRAAPVDRDRRRLRPHVRLVLRRLLRHRRGVGQRRPARGVSRRIAGRPRHPVSLLRPRRDLPTGLALRRDHRRAGDRCRVRRVGVPLLGHRRLDPRLDRVPAIGVSPRCDLRNGSGRRCPPRFQGCHRMAGRRQERADDLTCRSSSEPDGSVAATREKRARRRACGSSDSSTTMPPFAGAASPDSACSAPSTRSSGCSRRRMPPRSS